MIREAVSRFIEKKYHPVGMVSSYLPKASRDNYRAVTAYLPTSESNLVTRISRNTGKCKTELVRQAVDKYLGR